MTEELPQQPQQPRRIKSFRPALSSIAIAIALLVAMGAGMIAVWGWQQLRALHQNMSLLQVDLQQSQLRTQATVSQLSAAVDQLTATTKNPMSAPTPATTPVTTNNSPNSPNFGTLIVTFRDWHTEISLWAALAIYIASFILLYFIFRGAGALRRLPKTIQQLRNKQRLNHYVQKEKALQLLTNANQQGVAPLKATWQSLCCHLKQDRELLHVYTRFLICHQEDDLAIKYIERVLKKTWDAELVRLYGCAKSKSTPRQLKIAEAWLELYPQEPELLLCLGRLCIQEKFWGKARDYLRDYIKLAPSSEGYQALARVYWALGDQAAALDCFQKGAVKLAR